MDFLETYKQNLELKGSVSSLREELDRTTALLHVTPEHVETHAATDAEPQPHYSPVRVKTRTGVEDYGAQVDLHQMFASGRVELVDVGEDAIVVVEVPQNTIALADPDVKDIQMGVELGRSGVSGWSAFHREEYNPELIGRLGLMKYDRMRRSDATVRASARILKTPITGATWYVQPHQYDTNDEDRKIARFIQQCLTEYPTYTWVQMLWEALLMLDFGYYMFEKVYDLKLIEGVPRVVYKKLACRHPLDVIEWNYDSNGGPQSVVMYDERPVEIPIHKLAVFTFDGEGGDPRGISLYRSAYKHWYFKENLYKIDAIQKERHGIGIPIIKLPPGFSPSDLTLANELGANLRTNEKAHVVLPPNWEILFAKLEGQRVDALESARHHTEMIFQNVLAQAAYASAEGDAQTMMDLFYKSARYIADLVCGVYNKYCIPYLVQANWGIERYPELKVRRLGDTQEARTISFALRNLVGAGIVQVDDDLESWSREIMDAPMADPTTRREASTPQKPGSARVGPPRQAQAANQRPMPGQAAGNDQSGG